MLACHLDTYAEILLHRMLYGSNLYLTCKTMNQRSIQYNLKQQFFSFSPIKCLATGLLRKSYPKIDSAIPYVYLEDICVLGRVSKDSEDNSVCVIGKTSYVLNYLLHLLSIGIGFESLHVYSKEVFISQQRRGQYLNLGYGMKTSLSTVNIVDLRRQCNTIIPKRRHVRKGGGRVLM